MISKASIVTAMLAALTASICNADDAPPVAAKPADAVPGITIVNLHLPNAIPSDVFEQLGKQAGIKFSTNGNLWDQDAFQTENDVELTNRPFWSAVNEVCELWEISPQPNYGMNSGRKIMLGQSYGTGQKTEKLPTFEKDGFLVQAVAFNRQQNINYAMPQQSQNNCGVQMMVYVDPALHITSFSQNVKVTEAVDDAGNSMVTNQGNNVFYGGNQQQSLIYNCSAPLVYPDKPGKKISSLKCTIQMRGSESVDTMTVDKPIEAGEVSKEFGDMTVTFHSLTKSAQGYELKIGIAKDDDQGGGNLWGVVQSGQLEDAKGHSYGNFGGGGGGGNNGMAEYTVNYNSNQGMGESVGPPTKWVLEVPSKSHVIKLPVEFKDLKMP